MVLPGVEARRNRASGCRDTVPAPEFGLVKRSVGRYRAIVRKSLSINRNNGAAADTDGDDTQVAAQMLDFQI